jgi:hypothetical protein
MSRSVVTAILCAAAITGQFVAGKAARDAFLLTTLGFQALPGMIIISSACSILLVALHSRWAARVGPARLIRAVSALSGALFVFEWLLRFEAPAATAVLLFLHTSTLGPLMISGFWLVTTERIDPYTAKRRFGQIAGAGTMGGLIGALISERVAATFGAPAVLLALAGSQVLTIWLVARFASSGYTLPALEYQRPAARSVHERSPLRVIAAAPHLQHLVALVLLGSTSAALLDYVFKAKAVEAVGAGDPLLRFFAIYYAAISLITFIFQVLSSGALLERFGVAVSTGSPSVVLLAGTVGGLVAPGFTTFLLARSAESVFRGSWFRAGYELFYTPLAASEKRAVKSVVDISADRLGEGIGGTLIRLTGLLAPAAQTSATLWVAMACSAAAVLASSRLNRWYLQSLGRSLVTQATELEDVDDENDPSRTMLLRIRRANAAAAAEAVDEARDVAALTSHLRGAATGDRRHAIRVLCREDGLNPRLVQEVVPLLAGPLSDYALFALRKVAEERVGQLTDALLDPNQDDEIRRQLARVLSICVSQRAADALLSALDDSRFEVRHQTARSLAAIVAKNPRVRLDRGRVLDVVLREVTVSRPVWESRRLLAKAIAESPLDEFVRDRAGQSLAHVFTLLSLILPSEPLQIAFRSLQSENPYLRGTALEYLEGVLPSEIRGRLWPFLVEPSSPRATAMGRRLRTTSSSIYGTIDAAREALASS